MITDEELNAEATRVAAAIGDHVFIRFRESFLDDSFNELPPEQRKVVALVDGRKLTSADLRAIADALEKLNAKARLEIDNRIVHEFYELSLMRSDHKP